MEVTKLDKTGLDFLRNEEGCILHPYLDSRGIPTIGIGMTYYPNTGNKVTMNDPLITQDQADHMFLTVLKPYEATVSNCCSCINQNQFNACVSLCYNIGRTGFRDSTLVKKVTANPNDTMIAVAFMMWSKNVELKPRRKRESDLYFS